MRISQNYPNGKYYNIKKCSCSYVFTDSQEEISIEIKCKDNFGGKVSLGWFDHAIPVITVAVSACGLENLMHLP